MLIIKTNTIINNATINSNGSNGGYGRIDGGGGSGGGSINLFYNDTIIKGTITVNCGYGGTTSGENLVYKRVGGNGGAGCITIGNISTGTFAKDE